MKLLSSVRFHSKSCKKGTDGYEASLRDLRCVGRWEKFDRRGEIWEKIEYIRFQ